MVDEPSDVLLVDDEWLIRQQLSRALHSVGVRCDTACSGHDAIEKHQRNPYKLVVTDLRMPEGHGHALAVTLLGAPHPPKVIALTAVNEPRLVIDLKSRGVEDVVLKPVDYFVLAERLKGMLQSEPQPA